MWFGAINIGMSLSRGGRPATCRRKKTRMTNHASAKTAAPSARIGSVGWLYYVCVLSAGSGPGLAGGRALDFVQQVAQREDAAHGVACQRYAKPFLDFERERDPFERVDVEVELRARVERERPARETCV